MPSRNVKITLGTNDMKIKLELNGHLLISSHTSSMGNGGLNYFLVETSKSRIYFSQLQGFTGTIF